MSEGAAHETVIVNDEQSLLQLDVVRWRGRLWIVPAWVDDSDGGFERPCRLICLDSLNYREHTDRPYRYSLVSPIPRTVLDGAHPAPQFLGFEVVETSDYPMPLRARPA